MAAGAVRDACRAALAERERAAGRARSTSSASTAIRRTTPLDPETGQITGERAHVAFAACAMKVVAEVDVDLGLTRVVWIGAAQDVGKAVNPQQVEGQIEGGTAQGLGLALMEEIQTRDGLITNASFTDYLIPTALDMPPVESVLIEDPEPDAPYGVKGVGEPPTVVSTAAVVAGAARRDGPRARTRVPVTAGRHRRARLSANRHLVRADASPVGSRVGGSCRTTIATATTTIAAPIRIRHGQLLAAEEDAEHDRDDRVDVRVGRDEPERRVREQPDVGGVADDRAER